MGDLLDGYDATSFADEALDDSGSALPGYERLLDALEELGRDTLTARSALRDQLQHLRGVTFTIAGDPGERTLPLDLVPRVIGADDWSELEAGLIQRVKALNLFLADVYGPRRVLSDRVLPAKLVLGAPGYHRPAWGVRMALGTHVHVAGLDLVKGADRRWLVLEDNLRVPSGVSYVLENREILTRSLPELYDSVPIRPVGHYPAMLLEALRACAPDGAGDPPTVVLLTAGIFNSAYFEHVLLARHMGVDLVEGSDLFVDGTTAYMRTTAGPRRVDVIYRRIDEEFIDPLAFRADSLLGVPGLLNAARAGRVTVANAVGNGVADDKAVYRYVPDLIRYYLAEEPKLEQVRTLCGAEPGDLEEIWDRFDELVFKPVAGSGGYGLVIGPIASKRELDGLRDVVGRDPGGWIAQELVSLSRHPTFTGQRLEPRHIDLRPFIVTGERSRVLPGGLTRVALPEGSMVVNSSQGGGSKDTWVLRPPPGQRRERAELGRVAQVGRVPVPEIGRGQQPLQQHQAQPLQHHQAQPLQHHQHGEGAPC
jgi:uncharacterized circularly permuted ATP-grasp superfamily protein